MYWNFYVTWVTSTFFYCLMIFNIKKHRMTFRKSEQTFTNTQIVVLKYIALKIKACMPFRLDILTHWEWQFSIFPDTPYTAPHSLLICYYLFVLPLCLALKLDLIYLQYSFCSASHQPQGHSPFATMFLTNNYMMHISRHN